MAVPVNIYVQDDAPSPGALPGVQVVILRPTDLSYLAGATSNAQGVAAFLLEAGTYEVRAFKAGILLRNPTTIVVLDPPTPTEQNGFVVTGSYVGVFGVPMDPRLCRVIGRLVDFSNKPVAGALIRILAPMDLLDKVPKVVDGNAVSQSAMEFHTDQNGFVIIDLLRGGQYHVVFSGEEDEIWNMKIPDRPTANLFDLIHPYPVALTWDVVGNAVTLAVNTTLNVAFQIVFSDTAQQAAKLSELVDFMNSAPDIVDVVYQNSAGVLVLTGKAAGTASIVVKPKAELFPSRVPDYSIAGAPLAVTVTP